MSPAALARLVEALGARAGEQALVVGSTGYAAAILDRLGVAVTETGLDPDAAPKGPRGARNDPAAATEAQLSARRRFDAAVAAAGPGLADILWRIVCAGEGMREAERALGWPARAGRLVLGLALDRLADHYRLPRP